MYGLDENIIGSEDSLSDKLEGLSWESVSVAIIMKRILEGPRADLSVEVVGFSSD